MHSIIVFENPFQRSAFSILLLSLMALANNMFDEQGGIRRKRRRTDAAKTTSNVVSSSIHSLPQELVVEILAKVAAHSWDDLFNARLR